MLREPPFLICGRIFRKHLLNISDLRVHFEMKRLEACRGHQDRTCRFSTRRVYGKIQRRVY